MHSYKCWDCGNEFESPECEAPDCLKCGSERTGVDFRVGGGNYEHPIHSDALAVHPSQRAEHEKNFSYIKLDGQNRPVFNNFIDHRNYLEKINMRKVPQKLRAEGKRIA